MVRRVNDCNIEAQDPPFPLAFTKSFPVMQLNILSKKQKCLKCGEVPTELPTTNFFKCRKCFSVSRFSNLPTTLTLKVSFEDQEEVTIFHTQVEEYCQMFGISVDEDELTESFMKNEKSKIVFNRQNVCLSFV